MLKRGHASTGPATLRWTMKVDPVALEKEAEELQQRMMEALKAESQDQEITPPAPEDDAAAPEESTDTADESTARETPQEEVRGEQNPDDSEVAKELRIAEERLKNAQARMTKATQEAAELRRENATLQQHIAALQSQIAQAGNRQDAVDDELKALAEEYPDIAQPLLKKLSKLEETVTQYRSRIEQDQSQSTLQKHFDTIRQSHPDMDAIVVSDDFAGWLDRQSSLWQRVAQEGSAAEVVELLDRYKADFDPPQQPESKVEKARKFAEPSLPKARKPDQNANKRIWTRDEIRQMSLSDFEKYQSEIDLAYLEGRVR